MRYFLRQQENPFLTLAPEVEAALPERVKARLGYRGTSATLGRGEGPVEGRLVEGATAPVTDLHADD